jgi:hypothetical protein
VSDDNARPSRRQLASAKIDTTVPHSARIWNYWLGGKDNYPVDREVGDQILSFIPELGTSARGDRLFLGRTVRYLAGERGIRQFLDIGTGLPTVDNTHEVAQRVAPESRIVYVDNDPLVLVYAHALLTGDPRGATAYVEADVHDPETILAEAVRTLDPTRPTAIMMLGVLNFVEDNQRAASIVARLLRDFPAGSYLVISHPTAEVNGEAMRQGVAYWNEQGGAHMRLRTPEELTALFDGLDLEPPGVVTCTQWRPETTQLGEITPVAQYGGVARKPG